MTRATSREVAETSDKPLVRIAAVVRRRAVEPDIVELDLPDIEGVKPLDHDAVEPSY